MEDNKFENYVLSIFHYPLEKNYANENRRYNSDI